MKSTRQMNKDIRGILFDFGGTLDTGGDHWSHLLFEAWKSSGVDVPLALFREAYVAAEQEMAKPGLIGRHYGFKELILVKINLELQYLSQQGLFPPESIQTKSELIAEYCLKAVRLNISRNIPVLSRLSEKYRLGVVSNFYGNLEAVLKDLGIGHFFETAVDSSAEGIRKPDARLFLKGVNNLGLMPAQCVVVGDSYANDIQPAIEIGCMAIWLKGEGWDAEINPLEYPDTIYNLDEIFEKLN